MNAWNSDKVSKLDIKDAYESIAKLSEDAKRKRATIVIEGRGANKSADMLVIYLMAQGLSVKDAIEMAHKYYGDCIYTILRGE